MENILKEIKPILFSIIKVKKLTTEFYNTISSNWQIDLNNYKYKSTATDSTGNLVKGNFIK